MAQTPNPISDQTPDEARRERPITPLLLVRAGVGGVLMGLANLVPGISGGTMLLAAGVYPDFVEAVAGVTRLSRRLRPWIILAAVALPAVIAIAVLAGTIRDAVLMHRWIAYSLFIGLTLGGAPTLLKMLRPLSRSALTATVVAFVAMVALALAQEARPDSVAGDAGGGIGGLFAAGIAGWIVLAWRGMADLDAVRADSEEGSGLLAWGLLGTVLMILGIVFLHIAAHADEKGQDGPPPPA